MRHVVDVVLVEEVEADYPWAGADDLIDPFTVPENVAPLLLIHHDLALLAHSLVVAGHTHDQMHIREELLGLFKNTRMSNMIHIKHSIGVDADRPAWICAIVLHVLCCTHGAFPIYIVRLKEKTKLYLISAQAYNYCLETLSAHLLLLEIPLLDLEREFLPEVDCLPPAADEPPTINVLFLFPIR